MSLGVDFAEDLLRFRRERAEGERLKLEQVEYNLVVAEEAVEELRAATEVAADDPARYAAAEEAAAAALAAPY